MLENTTQRILMLAALAGIVVLVTQTTSPPTTADAVAPLDRAPVAFVPNRGQWEHDADYVAQIGPATVFVEDSGWVLALQEPAEPDAEAATDVSAERHARAPQSTRGVALRLGFVGAAVAAPVAEQPLAGVHHYFLGDDPAKWRTGVPRFGAVRLAGMYAGVDVRLREHERHLEYDLLLEPGADLERVVVHIDGAERLSIDAEGALVMHTALGPVRQPRPTTWQVGADGAHDPVACDYVLLGLERYGFVAPAWNDDLALVIDPGLLWSMTFGGSGRDEASQVALDSGGTVTVAGTTESQDFPTTVGAFDRSHNGPFVNSSWRQDTFVARLSTSGAQLVWSTFLGGSQSDFPWGGLHVDANGVVTVAGKTSSPNYPTTAGAYDQTFNSTISGPGGLWTNPDGFVTRLAASGDRLIWSTFLGGIDEDYITDMAVDPAGEITVTGATSSGNFPTTSGAYSTATTAGYRSSFAARLSASGSQLLWSTMLGGRGEWHQCLAVDAAGTVTLAGVTESRSFPTTPGAFDPTFNGSGRNDTNIYVSRLSSSGSQLLWSTFFGGPSTTVPQLRVAVDGRGAVTIAGTTDNGLVPTTVGALDPSFNGGRTDLFVSRLSPSGSQLLWSTFLGGSDWDSLADLAVDAAGIVTILGGTQSANFPVTPGAWDSAPPLPSAGKPYLMRLDPSRAGATQLLYSSFAVGSVAMASVGDGSVVLAGWANGDVFVAQFDMLPTGVRAFGDSSAGCKGPLAIGVTSWPQAGNTGFAITCTAAPPSASGALLGADRSLEASGPLALVGAECWLDPTAPLLVSGSATSDGRGVAERALPIPSSSTLVGIQLFAQWAWVGPNTPAPCPPLGLSTSNALEVTVQP